MMRTLTPRQREILALIAQGQSNAEVGASLGIATGTVKAHLATLYVRLGASDRAQAVAIALREGVIF